MGPGRRVAIITGGAGAIGSSAARQLAASGYLTVLADRADEVHAVAERLRKLDLAVESHVIELGSEAEIRSLATRVLDRHGRIDALVNNAGIHIYKGREIFPVEELTLEQWNTVMSVNLTAQFLLCREVFPSMKARRWGRIVNIASRAGRTWSAGTSVDYAASKAGVIGLTRALAGEGARFGITVNAVAPGRVSTPLADRVAQSVIDDAAKAIPVGRLGVPDDIGCAIAYLASEQASYVTGAVLDVNGGYFMG